MLEEGRVTESVPCGGPMESAEGRGLQPVPPANELLFMQPLLEASHQDIHSSEGVWVSVCISVCMCVCVYMKVCVCVQRHYSSGLRLGFGVISQVPGGGSGAFFNTHPPALALLQAHHDLFLPLRVEPKWRPSLT